jgi:hypothetical protein
MGTKLTAVFGAVLAVFLLSACLLEGGGDLPWVSPVIPGKGGIGSRVKALCYIDVSKHNPLNAGDYTLSTTEVQFFDYVVLGAAQIKFSDYDPRIYLPPDLEYVLKHRNTYIRPLQLKGIKVLLGITGGEDNYSFGSLSDDEVHVFVGQVIAAVEHYGLDGVEFNDENAGRPGEPFYPDELMAASLLGDKDGDGDDNDADDERAAWRSGGDKMNNLMYYLRLELDKSAYEKTIVVREKNFGACFPFDVTGSEGVAVFVGSLEQTNYFVNPDFGAFKGDGAQTEADGNPWNGYRDQYAPFMVNLGGDLPDTVIPNLTNADPNSIFSYNTRFSNGNGSGACDYGLLYYYNLRATSEVPAGYLNVTYDTQAKYLTITAQGLFQRMVVCNGGDHLKDW